MFDSSTCSEHRPADLKISHVELEDGVCLVTVEGEIDLSSAPALKASLGALVAAGHRRFVLDLSRVTHMDSTGLGVLIAFRMRLPDGGVIALAEPASNVQAVFELTGANRTLGLFATLDGALSHVRAKDPRRRGAALSSDAAMVLGLAATAMPFADSRLAEAERWLRTLRLHGEAGRALTALGLGEAPLVEVPAGVAGDTDALDGRGGRDAIEAVIEHARRHASRRGCATVGTADLLLGVMGVYQQHFDVALEARGSSREEVIEQLSAGSAAGD